MKHNILINLALLEEITLQNNSFLSCITLLLVIHLTACSEKVETSSTLDKTTTSSTKIAMSSTTDQFADKVFINGKIITVNDQQPNAQVVAIKNGLIIYVGDLLGAKPLLSKNTEQIDLDGLTMVPGFVDAHGHVVSAGLQAASANLLPLPDGQVNSFSELTDSLRSWAATDNGKIFIDKTGWLVGFGFDDSQLKEQVFPTAKELDFISDDKPLMIIHQSGHFGVFNNVALKKAGIDDCQKVILGGAIRCQADGKTPNGVLEENAFFAVLANFQGSIDSAFNIDLFNQGMASFSRFGYTTAQEGRAFSATMDVAVARLKQGELPIDVAIYLDYSAKKTIDTSAYYSGSGYEGINYQNGLRIAGVKLTLDGSPQGKTAWLSKPYFVPPQGQDKSYLGYPAMTTEQVETEVMDAFAENRQVLAHCNGDAAIDRYLDAIEKATKKYGKADRRIVLIHGQTLRKDQIPRLKELAIIPSLFPMHTFYWGDWHKSSVLGPERAAYISPTRDVLDAGLIFTSHHDAPVALPDSMRVLSATVTRVTRSGEVLGPDQRVTPYEGLKAITIWPAYQHFEEKRKGSIEVGKQADFVILSANPLTVDPLTIADIKVLETINNGVTVFKLNTVTKPKVIIGSDKDEKACIGSAGYQWCSKLAQCIRPWELTKQHNVENTPETLTSLCN
ncbi:MAG: putative amidohydrolase YtcJ [Colwellia sp.]